MLWVGGSKEMLSRAGQYLGELGQETDVVYTGSCYLGNKGAMYNQGPLFPPALTLGLCEKPPHCVTLEPHPIKSPFPDPQRATWFGTWILRLEKRTSWVKESP